MPCSSSISEQEYYNEEGRKEAIEKYSKSINSGGGYADYVASLLCAQVRFIREIVSDAPFLQEKYKKYPSEDLLLPEVKEWFKTHEKLSDSKMEEVN